VRTLGGLALFWFLSRKTRARVASGATRTRSSPTWPTSFAAEYEKLSANWQGDAAEAAVYSHELRTLSPQLVLTFVGFFSVMGWDFIMDADAQLGERPVRLVDLRRRVHHRHGD